MNSNGRKGRWAGWVRLTSMLIFCLAAAFSLQQGKYDLLLKGGYVIDPKNGISGHRDVAISQGKIAAVAESIDASKATRTLDVQGLYITPGLVDLHVHIFSTTNIPGAWAGDNSVQPDSNTLPTGGGPPTARVLRVAGGRSTRSPGAFPRGERSRRPGIPPVGIPRKRVRRQTASRFIRHRAASRVAVFPFGVTSVSLSG